MKKILKCLFFFAAPVFLLASCHSEKTDDGDDGDNIRSRTPVTVTTVTHGDMNDVIRLNATAAYLVKIPVTANANGYIEKVYKQLNQFVKKGDEIFLLRTKEAATLQNTALGKDTAFRFRGEIVVRADEDGYISQLNFAAGNYVQDGEQLATINVASSFVFLLNLPYEYKPFLPKNNSLQLLLPDSTLLNGTISNELPVVDPASQTQSIAIRVNSGKMLPENLIAVVTLVRKSEKNATALPKAAILTDDIQSSFWVMKMINDSTAVKVTVTKGIEDDGKIQILSPQFSDSDKILVTGNYALPDTAQVKISNQ